MTKLSTKSARLQRLAPKYAAGECCPSCGAGTARIDDNGQEGHGLGFLCHECEHQWDADEYRA